MTLQTRYVQNADGFRLTLELGSRGEQCLQDCDRGQLIEFVAAGDAGLAGGGPAGGGPASGSGGAGGSAGYGVLGGSAGAAGGAPENQPLLPLVAGHVSRFKFSPIDGDHVGGQALNESASWLVTDPRSTCGATA